MDRDGESESEREKTDRKKDTASKTDKLGESENEYEKGRKERI